MEGKLTIQRDSMLVYFILFAGACSAAAVSGAAGFGGALLLLPLLTAFLPAPHAVPLLTAAQLVGNLSRVAFGFARIQWKPVAVFLMGAAPFCMLGASLFIDLPEGLVTRCIGIIILLLVIFRIIWRSRTEINWGLFALGGGVVGFLSGLAGSAGPLGAAFFLTLGLPPVAYVASEATSALVIHALKMIVYRNSISLDRQFWLLALLLAVAMVFGTWISKQIIERISKQRFQKFVATMLIGLALYLIICG